MRINFSTLFQIAVLIVQDVLNFEAQSQTASNPSQTLPSVPAATEATTPVAPNLDTQDDKSVTP